MSDPTASNRVQRQRARRLKEGWEEVRVWVPTADGAEEIRERAREMRSAAERLAGLQDKIPKIDPSIVAAIATAILEHGSAAYSTPSGPMLTLLSELAATGDLWSFSLAFVAFAKAKPPSAKFVEASVPAFIRESFWIKNRGVMVDQLLKFQEGNPDWEAHLKRAVRDPDRFKQVVNHYLAEIRAH